ncbi:MAG: Crp/Fnr family transcriptional regulator [Okeania sp. SIO2F4]|uniref:Crp/Fnr family transcriptional regulator n=1 Tax=Okeania sp. SIO2F4 TaxID=2607790 RepID=UPI00142AFAAD|nr:Crp/Fnr family transcriptional regulator [Okeania sp. SIO2F4]MDJ0518413.1 Crp/Fnr family transcriptional regulator [Trichodesmium sp. MO_231.B1]NES07989.1 Crp/Fnr family transcriptional regulator [Okeania sp. SIO2F4]
MNEQISKISQFIANTQMFNNLPSEHLQAVSQIAKLQTYQKKEPIFWEGEKGRGCFIIFSGKVKIFKFSPEGKEQILHIFTRGEHFAEVPAFDGKCYPASAEALTKSELLFLPRQEFLKLLENQPTIAINMLSIFAKNLRLFAKLIEDLSLKEVPGRLAVYLLELSDRSSDPSEIKLDMTKSQLAASLGTIPETLSRVFAKLSEQKLISIDGKSIKLLNIPALRVLSAEKRHQ